MRSCLFAVVLLGLAGCTSPDPNAAESADPAAGAPSGGRDDDGTPPGAGSQGSAAGDPSTCPGGGPEMCFNGIDDDCNGKIDCEDTACGPVAACVPDRGASVGVLVDAGKPCPAGTSEGPTLHDGLDGGDGCLGCACEGSWSCAETVTLY